jgi:DNA-binding transcriptional LysR family regulator
MDVVKLRQLAAVVRLQSFSDAAHELGITQPALSKSVRALERDLGVQLLERGRFGARPTAFGLALARHADAVDAELRVAREEIAALRSARTGRLCIGCGPSEATRLLPIALDRLQRRAPNVEITVLYGLNEALAPMVKHGEVDFALSSIPSRASDPELRHLPVHEDAAAIIVRRGHRLAELRRPLTAADLEGCRWVLARLQELERHALEDALRGLGAAPPQAVIETTSAVLMKSIVMRTDCLTFLPRDLVYWEERARQLVALRLAVPGWRRTVGITTRARARLSPVATAMIDELKRAAQDMAR